MSIHDYLKQAPTPEIKDLTWAKALELAKVPPHEGRGFNSEAWLDKAKHWGREELKWEVYKHLTGKSMSPTRWPTSSSSKAGFPSSKRLLMSPRGGYPTGCG